MPYTAIPVESLPKRVSRVKEADIETANALLALVSIAGQAASDGESYPTQADARKEAGKARRMLVRVASDPELVKSRVYGTDADGWRWAVSIGTPEEKAAKAKSKSK